MNVTPKGTPAPTQSVMDSSQAKAQAAKARAVAILQGQPEVKPQLTGNEVVRNQNQVSAEELGAIKAPNRNTIPEVEAQDSQPQSTQNEPTKAPEDPISTQYAQLARREKQLRIQAQKQQQAIQAKEEALKQREAALAAKDTEYQSNYIRKDQLKQNALQALNEAGVPYDQLVQQYIDQTANPIDPRVNATISQLQQQIAELKAANEEVRKSSSEQQTQQYEAAVKQIRLDAVSLVKSEPDQFELIQATKSIDDVVDLIKRTHAEEGRVMTVEEAAQEVENYLLEESLRLSNLKKIRAKNQAGSTPASSNTETQLKRQPQPMKTLTNAATNSRQLSSKERAILAFKGEL